MSSLYWSSLGDRVFVRRLLVTKHSMKVNIEAAVASMMIPNPISVARPGAGGYGGLAGGNGGDGGGGLYVLINLQ